MMADEQSPAKSPARKHGFLALEGRLRPSAQAPKPAAPPAPQEPTEATPETTTAAVPQEPTEQPGTAAHASEPPPETPPQPPAAPSYRPVALEAQATHASAGAATLMGPVALASDSPATPASSIPDVAFGPCTEEPPSPPRQPETFAVPQSAARQTLRDEPRVIVRDENKLTRDEIELYISKGAQFSKVEDAAEREGAFAEALDHLIKVELDKSIPINSRARCWYEARHPKPVPSSRQPTTDARDEEITSARTTPRRSHVPANMPRPPTLDEIADPYNAERQTAENDKRFPALAPPKSGAANAATDKAPADKEAAPKPKRKPRSWFIGTCFGLVAAVVIVIGVQCARQSSNAKAADSAASATPPGQLMTACEAVTPDLLREYFGQDDPTDFKQGVATAYRDSRVKQHEKIRDINCGTRVQITDNKIDVSECCVEP